MGFLSPHLAAETSSHQRPTFTTDAHAVIKQLGASRIPPIESLTITSSHTRCNVGRDVTRNAKKKYWSLNEFDPTRPTNNCKFRDPTGPDPTRGSTRPACNSGQFPLQGGPAKVRPTYIFDGNI